MIYKRISLFVVLIFLLFIDRSFASIPGVIDNIFIQCKSEYVSVERKYGDFDDAYYDAKDEYEECYDSYYNIINNINNKAEAYTEGESYHYAIQEYENMLEYLIEDILGIREEIARLNLLLGFEHFEDKNYSSSLLYLNKAYDKNLSDDFKFTKYWLMAENNIALEKYKDASSNISVADRFAYSQEEMATIEQLRKEINNRENAIINDERSHRQYRLNKMNIAKARDSIDKDESNTVIIAVLDDGISINHPDLTDNIWYNQDELPGNGIDDDANGYVDDRNGYNFYNDTHNMLPTGSHGSMVAGIIGANSENNIGVAGIVKDVLLMPVIVCGEDSCSKNKLGEAVRYAVDNGANIINLSLGDTYRGYYSDEITDDFAYAVDNGALIIVAAGNGDRIQSQEKGVNTSLVPISPVCNENRREIVIGVGASNESGEQTSRSNYGNCVDVYTFGENIVSTSTVDYDIMTGTSFASPIVAGVLGLGYNQYGAVDYKIVYKALLASVDDEGIIDAYVYLRNLDNLLEDIIAVESADSIYERIMKVAIRLPMSQREMVLDDILEALNRYIVRNKGKDKYDMAIYLRDLLQ